MAAEAGQIARGTVVHLMPYGALVRLEDGTTGLVHISEIDQNFVHNVADHVQKGNTVVVKVLSAGEKGKTELSIKQAKGQELTFAPPVAGRDGRDSGEAAPETPAPPPPHSKRESRANFEEKMRDFLDVSSERLSDLRRHTDSKLGRKPR